MVLRHIRAAVVLLIIGTAACSGDPAEPNGGVDFVPTARFATLSAGFDRTCAVQDGGGVFCWGRGVLANGEAASNLPVPFHLAGNVAGVAVAVGDAHGCAVVEGGGVQCWGDGEEGRLGFDATGVAAPRAVSLPRPAAAVAAGRGHSCALDADGAVYCWGRGSTGELGTGVIGNTSTPAEFGRGFLRFHAIAAGEHHTCALARDGRIFCSGWNVFGQLGIGVFVNVGGPEPVASGDVRFTALSAGRHHTCALATDGRVFCWGRGDGGQLGDGGFSNRHTPAPVSGGRRYRAITAGGEHSCAVADDGSAYCWGRNRYGRLGNGRLLGEEPVPVAVVGDVRYERLNAGEFHTCGLTADGSAWCWGFGGFGQLGSASGASSAEPVAVARPRS